MSGYYYHYTTYKGMIGIKESGYIKPSTGLTRDAVLGEGVYFTHLPPHTDPDELLYNNYGHSGKWQSGKVKYCVKFKKSQLAHLREKRRDGRLIFCYPDQVNLRDYDFEIIDVMTGEVLDTSDWSWVTKVALGAAAVFLCGAKAALVGLGVLVLGRMSNSVSPNNQK